MTVASVGEFDRRGEKSWANVLGQKTGHMSKTYNVLTQLSVRYRQ